VGGFIYGSPDDIDSIVTPIMKTLCIPQDYYTRVKSTLQDLKAEIENADAYAEKKDGIDIMTVIFFNFSRAPRF